MVGETERQGERNKKERKGKRQMFSKILKISSLEKYNKL